MEGLIERNIFFLSPKSFAPIGPMAVHMGAPRSLWNLYLFLFQLARWPYEEGAALSLRNLYQLHEKLAVASILSLPSLVGREIFCVPHVFSPNRPNGSTERALRSLCGIFISCVRNRLLAGVWVCLV